jgi:hypothetical protein
MCQWFFIDFPPTVVRVVLEVRGLGCEILEGLCGSAWHLRYQL